MESPVYTLLCKRDIDLASVTIPLMLKQFPPGKSLVVLDDGSFGEEDRARIASLGSNVEVCLRAGREESVCDRLKNHPACQRYRREFPLSQKLIDLPLICKEAGHGQFLYTDADILYLAGCRDFFAPVSHVHLRTDAIKLSVKLGRVFFTHHWKIPWRFNAGYFSFPLESYDLDFVEHFLTLPDCRQFPWLIEQTCWAVLFGRLKSALCPDSAQFVCQENFSGPDSNTRAVHLIGSLKRRALEWSTMADPHASLPPARFEPSRGVSYRDWFLKTLGRLAKRR